METRSVEFAFLSCSLTPRPSFLYLNEHNSKKEKPETLNMPLSQTLQSIFSKALDFLTALASAFKLPGPAASVNPTPQIRHHHHKSSKVGDEDHAHQSSQAAWLESRGYRDSFAKDDEIKPDPKEDVMIND
jgi:hypothetical protein